MNYSLNFMRKTVTTTKKFNKLAKKIHNTNIHVLVKASCSITCALKYTKMQ